MRSIRFIVLFAVGYDLSAQDGIEGTMVRADRSEKVGNAGGSSFDPHSTAGLRPPSSSPNVCANTSVASALPPSFPMNTSIIEGVNNRIKVINRSAYGFRDSAYSSDDQGRVSPKGVMNQSTGLALSPSDICRTELGNMHWSYRRRIVQKPVRPQTNSVDFFDTRGVQIYVFSFLLASYEVGSNTA